MSNAERHLTRQGQDRKADLLRVAEELFTTHGYADTRIIDIARAAGVAKGLFYWYFENKEALFREIIVDIRNQLRGEQKQALIGVEHPLERVYVGTYVSVRFVAAHHRLYGLIQDIVRDKDMRKEYAESAGKHAGDTAGMLREGQRIGVVRVDDDALALSHGNTGIVNNYVVAYLDGLLPGPIDEVAHVAARFAVRGVAADHDVGADAIKRARRRLAARRRTALRTV